ncbi:MAG: hypothetical protein C0404_09700 [Verrucomicrobia bacterium]|nr:hypothetical protein [Verrucomicrobiota bacterium]
MIEERQYRIAELLWDATVWRRGWMVQGLKMERMILRWVAKLEAAGECEALSSKLNNLTTEQLSNSSRRLPRFMKLECQQGERP